MTHFIFDPDIIEKIATVEAFRSKDKKSEMHEFIDQQSNPNWDSTVPKALEDWEQYCKDIEDELDGMSDADFDDAMRTVATRAIYGLGGWNRYFVRGSGEVVISKRHASSETIEFADKYGFEIFR